jgi:hypothetical protein
VKLAEHNRVQLIWEQGNEGTECNETANQLAKLESECPLIGSEPTCGTSAGISKKAVRDWTNRDHKKYWESLRTQTGKGIPTRILCQKNQGAVKIKQKPVTMWRTTHRTLSPERTPLQNGINEQSHL